MVKPPKTFVCTGCGKLVRRTRFGRGRPPIICAECKMTKARNWQREYARKKAAEARRAK